VATVADGYLSHLEVRQVVDWFDLGGSLQLADTLSAADVIEHATQVQGLVDLAHAAGVAASAAPPLLASGIDFVLEGLYALKKISRSEDRGYHGAEPAVRRPTREANFDEEPRMPTGPGKKKYYN
jgi:magnesium chelatase subunit I